MVRFGRSIPVVVVSAAFLIGCAYSVLLLHWSAVSEATEFWAFPRGLIGSALDIQNALSGYLWFAQDAWRWPLLHVVRPNSPEGMNAELFDVIPIVSIFGKIVFTLTGQLINPFPWWVTACFGLNAVALCLLVRSLGARSVSASLVASCLGALAPVVQHRFGHLGLLAHWLPMFCLALFFNSRSRRVSGLDVGLLVWLCGLAASVHLYLYVMTAAIATAILLQAWWERRLTPVASVAVLAAVLMSGVTPLWAFGLLGTMDVAPWTELSRYSMNLVSPFWPQSSGLFSWTGSYWLTRGSIGATPGQYEGFDYLGGGSLLLIVLGSVLAWREVWAAARSNAFLTLVLVTLLAWALSNHVYAGPYLLLTYPTPAFLNRTVLSWFRSSGRFFWPLGWLLIAFGVAAIFRKLPFRSASLIGLIAVGLQFVDVLPWIGRFARLREDVVLPFGSEVLAARVSDAIKSTGSVAVVPPIFCSSDGGDYQGTNNVIAMQVQLLAARANAQMTSVYVSRASNSCAKSVDLSEIGTVVLLDGVKANLRSERDCFDAGRAVVCTRRTGGGGL